MRLLVFLCVKPAGLLPDASTKFMAAPVISPRLLYTQLWDTRNTLSVTSNQTAEDDIVRTRMLSADIGTAELHDGCLTYVRHSGRASGWGRPEKNIVQTVAREFRRYSDA